MDIWPKLTKNFFSIVGAPKGLRPLGVDLFFRAKSLAKLKASYRDPRQRLAPWRSRVFS
jgi:hypothetical protein